MNSVLFGIVEIVLGGLGLAMGRRGLSRGGYIVAVGLVVMGVSHLIPLANRGILTDVGGIMVLLGLGMMLGRMRKNRKGGDGPSNG